MVIMSKEESIKSFNQNWYLIFDLEKESYQKINNSLINEVCKLKDFSQPLELNKLHENLTIEDLNPLRVELIKNINLSKDFKKNIIKTSMSKLDLLIGNELAIQKKANLSIQLPNDDTSLLPIHSDVWAGNSPYELVLWIPFCDVFETKSFFLINKEKSIELNRQISLDSKKDLKSLREENIESVIWPEVKKGQAILFSHSLLHGNIKNQTDETRVSLNMRIKSLLSPYSTKGLGDFFEIYNVKPATEIGLKMSNLE